MAQRSLAEMVKLPIVARHLGPLLERHKRSLEILRQRIEERDGVLFFDISDLDLEGHNKFIPYLLYPHITASRYSVGRQRIGDPRQSLPWVPIPGMPGPRG